MREIQSRLAFAALVGWIQGNMLPELPKIDFGPTVGCRLSDAYSEENVPWFGPMS